MKRQLTILAILAFYLAPLVGFGQKTHPTKDSLPFDNRKYRNEVGIDVQGIFAGYIGGSFMYKKRTGDSKLIAVSYSDNLRFGGYLGGSFNKYSVDSALYYNITDNDAVIVAEPKDNNNQYIGISVGKERVHYYGRFNVYYGMDIGSSIHYSATEDTRYSSYFSNGYATLPVRSSQFSVTALPFVGLKYRISNRLSLSAEAFYALGYRLSRTQIGDKKSNQAANQDPVVYYLHSINHRFEPLRFITLNYHFKQFR